MQKVSDAWKENQKRTLTNEGFVEVSLDITDPDAQSDASSQDNGASYISNTSQVVDGFDKTIVPYSTLEQNMWVLDGKRKILPIEDYGDCGYIGNVLSGDNCSFTNKSPMITINFTKVHRNIIPAITITWGKAYGEFAKDFLVTVYNGDEAIARKEVLGNTSVTTVVDMDIVDYDRITITILKWCLPCRRARIEEIFIGLNKVYGKSNLFGYSHQQTVDPISTSLPKMEIQFSVDNSDNSYNPYNDKGLSKYLMDRQEVKVRYGHKNDDNTIEWIKGGTFYLSEWSAPQNGLVADFTARDLLEFMFAEYRDEVTAIGERSLYDLAESVLMSADLPLNSDGSKKWYIDESLKEIYTTAPLPVDSRANCLQMIANAGCCVIYQDRKGVLRIEPLYLTVSDYSINMFNSRKKPEIVLSKPVRSVVVKVHQYSIADGKIEEQITDEVTSVGATGESVDVDNPLITDANRAHVVGAWVGNYLKNRMSLEVEWRADTRLDALDIVKVANDYGNTLARMTDVTFKFNGAFQGSGKGSVI